jgi:hypothetical protein
VFVFNPALPIEEARYAWESPGNVPGAPALLMYGSTVTDETGYFEVKDLPDGSYNVRAVLHRRSKFGVQTTLQADLSGVNAGASDLVFTLPVEPANPPTTNVEGSVRNAKTGKPLLRFEAQLSPDRGFLRAERTAPGRFRFADVPLGTYRLSVAAEGYATYERPAFEIKADEQPLLEIAMTPGITVRGTVRGPVPLRLEGESILFLQKGHARGPSSALAPDGSYSAAGFAPGVYTPILDRTSIARKLGIPGSLTIEPAEITIPPNSGDLVFDIQLVVR